VIRHEHDAAFLTEVLDCYKPHCRYLTSSVVETTGGVLRGTATLAIPESCYIDDTGHLNGVEVSICYNQMLYHTIGTAVRHRIGDVFSAWSMEDFRRRKLPDILIARFASSFHRPINPRSFHGEITFNTVTQRRLHPDREPLISLDTSFRYWDDNGGSCRGAVRVAVVASRPAEVGRAA
jgi:FcoT-like thioesterase domain